MARCEQVDSSEFDELRAAIHEAYPVLLFLYESVHGQETSEDFKRYYGQYTQLLKVLEEVPVAWANVSLDVDKEEDEPELPDRSYRLPPMLPKDFAKANPSVDETDLIQVGSYLYPDQVKEKSFVPPSVAPSPPPKPDVKETPKTDKRQLRSSGKSDKKQTGNKLKKRKRSGSKGGKKKSGKVGGNEPNVDESESDGEPPKKIVKRSSGSGGKGKQDGVKSMDPKEFGKQIGDAAAELLVRRQKSRKGEDPTKITMEEVQELNVEDAIAPSFACVVCLIMGKECRVIGFGGTCGFCQAHSLRCTDHMSAEEILIVHRRLGSLYAISSDRKRSTPNVAQVEMQKLARDASDEAASRYQHLFSLSTTIIDALGPQMFLEHFAGDDQPELIVEHFNAQVDNYNAIRHGTSVPPSKHFSTVAWDKLLSQEVLEDGFEVPIFSPTLNQYLPPGHGKDKGKGKEKEVKRSSRSALR
ncbi:hypothetical protein C8R47DRAFT_1170770 [Mycena vitilis]|nr:hypothetical protein C8R47DRAFT_1170770 [Mycena vitilis]